MNGTITSHKLRTRLIELARARHELGLPPVVDWATERDQYEREMAKAARVDHPVESLLCGDVECAIIGSQHRQGRIVLFLHGGGYTMGSPATHRGLAARIGDASEALVVLPRYRLAPEHPYPAALDDARAVWDHLLDDWQVAPESIAVVGDSAGGGLAAALVLMLMRDQAPLPAALVLMSPWTDLSLSSASVDVPLEIDPLVDAAFLRAAREAYLAGHDVGDPLVSPVHGDWRGGPPTLIQATGSERLVDDARRLFGRLACDGVEVCLEEWDELVHVWHQFAPAMPQANDAIERIGRRIRRSCHVVEQDAPIDGPRRTPTREVVSFAAAGVRLTGDLLTPAGDEKGTAILLHGGGQTRHSWGATAVSLAQDGWKVLSYDARGHGDSEWERDGHYGIDMFVDDLVKAGEWVGGSPVLVGASLGGITSLLAVGESRIEAPRGVVLVDVAPTVNRAGVDRIHEFMLAHQDGFDSLEEVAGAIAYYNPRKGRQRSDEGLRKNVRQRADGRWYWHWDPVFLTPEKRGRELVDRERLRAASASVVAPSLLVHGQHSDVVTGAELDDFLSLIPHAEIQHADAGHMVAGDNNSVFADGLITFLNSL